MNTRKMTLNEELFRMKQLFGHMGISASLITESGPGGPGTGTAIGDAIGSGTGVITKTLGKDVVQSIEYSLYKAAKENSEFLSRIGKTSSDISLDDIRTAFRNSTSDTEALGTIAGKNSTVYNEISNLFVEKLKPKTTEISSSDETVKTVKSDLELASKNLGTDDNAWSTFADSLVILKQDVETVTDQAAKTKLNDIIETYETAVNTRNVGKNNNISFNEPIVTTKTTINLDPTQGGKLDTNKPVDNNLLISKEPDIIEPFKPRNYDWIFGGDLKNHVGEFKSDWISEDAIDYSKLEGKYDKYIDYGEEFPEDIIYEKLINDIRYGFYRLKNGNTYDTWNQFPIGGFKKYGINNFRKWVKNLYKKNRLTNIEIDKDGVPFQFKIEPESKKVQPAVLHGELPKSNFDEKMAWDLRQIADDPKLTPEEKYKKTLEKTNYYWRMKNVRRGVKKLEDKKNSQFVLDDNGNIILDPNYKPEPWEQDPDLNESIIKDINKIKKLL